MSDHPKLQITLVSGSCCAPHLAQLDKELEKNLKQALGQLTDQVEVKTVSLSSILEGPQSLNAKQRGQLLSLFQKYSARMCPAVLIGDQIRFAGSVPTVEQLKDTLDTAVREAT